MPPRPTHDPAYLDEHHEAISRFAETYFDDEEERDGFITELMSRRGYTARTRTDWEPPADPKGGSNGGQGGGQQRQKPAYFKR